MVGKRISVHLQKRISASSLRQIQQKYAPANPAVFMPSNTANAAIASHCGLSNPPAITPTSALSATFKNVFADNVRVFPDKLITVAAAFNETALLATVNLP